MEVDAEPGGVSGAEEAVEVEVEVAVAVAGGSAGAVSGRGGTMGTDQWCGSGCGLRGERGER